MIAARSRSKPESTTATVRALGFEVLSDGSLLLVRVDA